MLAGAVGFIDVEPDAEMIGADLRLVQKASEQRVARPCNRMEGACAVERISEPFLPAPLAAPGAILDFEAASVALRRKDAPGDDLATACSASAALAPQAVS